MRRRDKILDEILKRSQILEQTRRRIRRTHTKNRSPVRVTSDNETADEDGQQSDAKDGDKDQSSSGNIHAPLIYENTNNRLRLRFD